MSKTSGRVRATLTVLDQAISSVSNLLLVFLAVRTMSTDSFGIFSAALAACTALLMVSRVTLGSSVAFAAEHGRPAVAQEARLSLGLLTCIGPALVGVVMLVSWLASGGHPAPFTWIVALATPLVLIQDQLRFAASATGTPGTALAADVVWVLAVIAVPALAILRSEPWTETSLLAAWAAGAALATSVLGVALRLGPAIRGMRAWISTTGRARFETATGASVRALSGVARLAAIGALSSTAILGALSAGQFLMAPLNLLAALVPFGLAPMAAKRRARGADAQRVYMVAGAVLGTVAVIWGLFCSLVPDDIGVQLLGQSWASAEPLIAPMTVMSAAILVTTTGFYALLSASRSRHYMRIQVFFAVSSLAAAFAIAAVGGGASSLAWTEAAVVCLVAALTWIPVGRRRTWSDRRNMD